MKTFSQLNKTKWSKPDSYFGHNPEGDFVLYSLAGNMAQILDESNFECFKSAMEKAEKSLPPDDDREQLVTTWRASHWACGSVTYLMLSKAAPDDLKQAAEDILEGLAQYPVVNEDDYSERQYNAAGEYWDSLSAEEKKEYGAPEENDGMPDDFLQSEMFY